MIGLIAIPKVAALLAELARRWRNSLRPMRLACPWGTCI